MPGFLQKIADRFHTKGILVPRQGGAKGVAKIAVQQLGHRYGNNVEALQNVKDIPLKAPAPSGC